MSENETTAIVAVAFWGGVSILGICWAAIACMNRYCEMRERLANPSDQGEK